MVFGENVTEDFGKKTDLSSPELYYWNHEQPFTIEPVVVEGQVTAISGAGDQLVLKACNRCARFLPINLLDERKQLGFNNHCVRRAPCTHKAFSRFALENSADLDRIEPEIQDKINGESGLIQAYYGFQLECRALQETTCQCPIESSQKRCTKTRRRSQKTGV